MLSNKPVYQKNIVKPESEVPKSKVPKSRPKGLGLTLKSHDALDPSQFVSLTHPSHGLKPA